MKHFLASRDHDCFGCGNRNPHGLKLHFTKKNNMISGKFNSSKLFEGFPNILHGGIQSTILDEAMNWLFFIEGIFVVTTKIELKFRLPIPINESIIITAEEIEQNKKFYRAKGKIMLQSGDIATESYGEFYTMNENQKHVIIEHFSKS